MMIMLSLWFVHLCVLTALCASSTVLPLYSLYAFFFVCLVLPWHFFNLSSVVQSLLPLSLPGFPHMKCYCVKPDTLSVPPQEEYITFSNGSCQNFAYSSNIEIFDIGGLSKYLPL